METISIIDTLKANSENYYLLRSQNKGVIPQAMSLEITQKCIAKCVMCNIWKVPSTPGTLTVNEWLSVLDSDFCQDLRELDITGGEPFLVKELMSLFEGIKNLKRTRLKQLRSVAITTNGLLSEKVLALVPLMADSLSEVGVELVVVCALDAVGPLHDEVRNYKNAWQKVDHTLSGLVKIRDERNNLIIGLKSTILPLNVKVLPAIAKYAAEKGLFTIISPIIYTAGRYLNDDLRSEFEFTLEQKNFMVDFFENNASKWNYHDQTLIDYLKTGTVKKPCACGYNYLFIRATGEVFLCPLIDKSPGNIKQTALVDVYFSQPSNEIRQHVGKMPDCVGCTEPGLERYALVFEGKELLTMSQNSTTEDFNEFIVHMGLDKYLH